ncbi:hypothetical protein K456DRAFT_516385 [Colletotrichum gloeosporioides 23]|nr:hypothetical protein K456DRAFT_516385 [Colletotrichum gloeosporioides 23]
MLKRERIWAKLELRPMSPISPHEIDFSHFPANIPRQTTYPPPTANQQCSCEESHPALRSFHSADTSFSDNSSDDDEDDDNDRSDNNRSDNNRSDNNRSDNNRSDDDRSNDDDGKVEHSHRKSSRPLREYERGVWVKDLVET